MRTVSFRECKLNVSAMVGRIPLLSPPFRARRYELPGCNDTFGYFLIGLKRLSGNPVVDPMLAIS